MADTTQSLSDLLSLEHCGKLVPHPFFQNIVQLTQAEHIELWVANSNFTLKSGRLVKFDLGCNLSYATAL
jgi:hypothetical protein